MKKVAGILALFFPFNTFACSDEIGTSVIFYGLYGVLALLLVGFFYLTKKIFKLKKRGITILIIINFLLYMFLIGLLRTVQSSLLC